MNRPSSSLRLRLTLGFCLTVAAVLLLFGAGLTLASRRVEAGDREELLRAAAREVRLALSSKGSPGYDPDNPDERAELRQAEADLAREEIRIAILGPDGAPRFRPDGASALPWPLPERGWRSVTLAAGPDTILVALPTARLDRFQRRQALYFGLFGLSVLTIAGVGAWGIIDRTLAPIRVLAREAKSFADPDAPSRPSAADAPLALHDPSHDAELVELVATLNALIERVAAEGAAKGRFYAAASHELRTPLQALAGQLELALSRPRTADEYRSSLEKADTQARRLMDLVNSLLLLNRIEGADQAPESEQVDIAALVAEDLSQLAPLLEERGLRVENGLPAEALVLAPPAHADVLVRNLLENAAKYALPGTALRVGWAAPADRPGRVRLTVFNTLPDEGREAFDDLKRLFEPFYRSASARRAFPAGNGLGLPLVKAVADRNGWSIAPHLSPEGVTFRVEMPAG
jgi:signal transduction histidine kinase